MRTIDLGYGPLRGLWQRRRTFALVLGLAMAGCRGESKATEAPKPVAVEVLTLAPSDFRETRELLGEIVSREHVVLLPQVAGYVRAIRVRPGERVTRGQTLVEVDARQQAAAVASVEAEKRASEADLKLAERLAERTEALFLRGLVSAEELEQARTELKTAQARSRSAAAQVAERRVGLQFFAVRSPQDGIVGDIDVRIGDFVTASTPITRITQADVLEVAVRIPAERARALRPETHIEILAPDGSVLVAAPVYFVAPHADPRTQLVELLARFDNAVGLRPSELVRTRVVYDERPALQVPALAVFRQSGQAFVYGVKEDEAGRTIVERRPVTLGALGPHAYIVEDGLEAGDRIAVSSLQTLRDGAAIQAESPTPDTTTSGPTAG